MRPGASRFPRSSLLCSPLLSVCLPLLPVPGAQPGGKLGAQRRLGQGRGSVRPEQEPDAQRWRHRGWSEDPRSSPRTWSQEEGLAERQARPGGQGAGRARWARWARWVRWARVQPGDLGAEPSSLASAPQFLCVRMDTPPGPAVKMETGSVFKPEAWATGAKSGSGSLAGIPLCRLLTVWALGEPLSEGAWGSYAGFMVLAPAGSHAAGSGRPGSGRELRPRCLSSGVRGAGGAHVCLPPMPPAVLPDPAVPPRGPRPAG